MEENKLNFWERIGFKKPIFFSSHPRWEIIVLPFLALYIITIIGVLINFLFVLKAPNIGSNNATDIRNVSLILMALLGVPLGIWRAKITWSRSKTAAEELITNRYKNAVEQICAVRRIPRMEYCNSEEKCTTWEEEVPNIIVHLGGLYALERISQDSRRDDLWVTETICAYLRHNFPKHQVAQENKTLGNYCELDNEAQRSVIDAALKILGYRSEENQEYALNRNIHPNLKNTMLQNCYLVSKKNFFADLEKADLSHSRLTNANLTLSNLDGANLQNANLKDCKLNGASLRYTDLRNAKGLDKSQLELAYGVRKGPGETKLPSNIEHHPIKWHMAENVEDDSDKLLNAYQNGLNKWYDSEIESLEIEPKWLYNLLKDRITSQKDRDQS